MKCCARGLLAFSVLLMHCFAVRAETIWSKWETSVPARHGPTLAKGALLYLPDAPADAPEVAISLPIREIARLARFDVLKLGWHTNALETDVIRFAADAVAELQRQHYAWVMIAGEGKQGALAIAVAGVAAVDRLLVLGPLDRPTADLERLLSASRAGRIGIVASRQEVVAFRDALRRGDRSDRTYMLIDTSQDIPSTRREAPGRFTRRYRDCLMRIAAWSGLSPGELTCDPTSGYARGREIGFEDDAPLAAGHASVGSVLKPFVGRWHGEDERGAYMILSAIRAQSGSGTIDFRRGYSPAPGAPGAGPRTDEVRCKLTGDAMTCASEDGEGFLRAHGRNELEYVTTYRDFQPSETFLLGYKPAAKAPVPTFLLPRAVPEP